MTDLLYLSESHLHKVQAKIIRVLENDGRKTVILDRTIFYPQGGGQPYDTGQIFTDQTIFDVEEVRFIDGLVHHIGSYNKGDFTKGETVTCSIDVARRQLHTRLHSAGHVLDMALNQMRSDWKPGKGYHFPDGPYVEYEGSVKELPDNFSANLEKICDDILMQDITTTIRFVEIEDINEYCAHVPSYLPEGKPCRVVLYGDYGVPCGGTHVNHLSDIGKILIRKVKKKKGVVRISYQVTSPSIK